MKEARKRFQTKYQRRRNAKSLEEDPGPVLNSSIQNRDGVDSDEDLDNEPLDPFEWQAPDAEVGEVLEPTTSDSREVKGLVIDCQTEPPQLNDERQARRARRAAQLSVEAVSCYKNEKESSIRRNAIRLLTQSLLP